MCAPYVPPLCEELPLPPGDKTAIQCPENTGDVHFTGMLCSGALSMHCRGLRWTDYRLQCMKWGSGLGVRGQCPGTSSQEHWCITVRLI